MMINKNKSISYPKIFLVIGLLAFNGAAYAMECNAPENAKAKEQHFMKASHRGSQRARPANALDGYNSVYLGRNNSSNNSSSTNNIANASPARPTTPAPSTRPEIKPNAINYQNTQDQVNNLNSNNLNADFDNSWTGYLLNNLFRGYGRIDTQEVGKKAANDTDLSKSDLSMSGFEFIESTNNLSNILNNSRDFNLSTSDLGMSFVEINHTISENITRLINTFSGTLISAGFSSDLSDLSKFIEKMDACGAREEDIIIALNGALVNHAILSDNSELLKVITADQEAYSESIRYLLWYYFALATIKGQSFTEGTFVVEDPDQRILAFLQNEFNSYGRISTHFGDVTKAIGQKENKANQKGLDLKRSLPENKSTLLFGKVDDAFTFIKPENHGLVNWSDIFFHTVDVVFCQTRKQLPKLGKLDQFIYPYVLRHWNKLSSEEIQAIQEANNKEFKMGISPWFNKIKDVVKTDDEDNFRKERIPQIPLTQFDCVLKLFVAENSPTAEAKSKFENIRAKFYQNAKVFGLHFIYNSTKRLLTIANSANTKNAAQALIKSLEENYDSLDTRIGREVILRTITLQNMVKDSDIELLLGLRPQ